MLVIFSLTNLLLKHAEKHATLNEKVAVSVFWFLHVRETFSAFLRRYRIERAQELYRAGDCDKREVPYAVGFSDAKYFNQIFRKITGMSPSEYLNEIVSI